MLYKPTIFLIMLLTFVGSISFAQEIESEEIIDVEKTDDGLFVLVEEMPEFPGGQEAMFKFLSTTIIYPKEARDKGIQGKVYVSFTIEKDGAISEVKVLRGVHPLLDEEAVRVVESFPNWKPGKQKGKEVRVSYNLPLSFVLNNNKKEKKKKKKKKK